MRNLLPWTGKSGDDTGQDHLGGTLDNLRFFRRRLGKKPSPNVLYHPIRFGQMLDLFKRTGFGCHFLRAIRWETLPAPRAKLNAFRQLRDEDSLVSDFDVVLRRQA